MSDSILPKKIALAVTSYYGDFYPDGKKTGAYWSEVYHPYKVFTEAGYGVDLVSETGKFGWDEGSLAKEANSEEDFKVLQDENSEFAKWTKTIKRADEVDPKDYGAFFAAGGHGTCFDFDGNAPLVTHLAAKIFDRFGIISGVCHGPILFGYIRSENGHKVLQGRKYTGFSEKGEVEMDTLKTVRERGAKVVNEAAGDVGYYIEPPKPFDAWVVSDGKIVSGANPASAKPTAEAVIAAFNHP